MSELVNAWCSICGKNAAIEAYCGHHSARERLAELRRQLAAKDATIAQLVAACENALTAIEPIHSKGGMSLTIAAIKLRAAIDAAASDNEGETK